VIRTRSNCAVVRQIRPNVGYRRRFLLLTIGRGTLHVGRARLRYRTVRHQLTSRWVALGRESLRHVHILRDSWIIDDGGRERIDHRRVVMRPTVTHLLRVVGADSQNLSVAYLSVRGEGSVWPLLVDRRLSRQFDQSRFAPLVDWLGEDERLFDCSLFVAHVLLFALGDFQLLLQILNRLSHLDRVVVDQSLTTRQSRLHARHQIQGVYNVRQNYRIV